MDNKDDQSQDSIDVLLKKQERSVKALQSANKMVIFSLGLAAWILIIIAAIIIGPLIWTL